MQKTETEFNFKNLFVWQRAIDFATEIILLIDKLNSNRKHYRLIENLESAADSIPSNFAEGKGRNSQKEFKQYLYISRGSLYEVVSKLNLFFKLKWIVKEELDKLESEATEIVKMLNGLINKLSDG